MMPVSVAENWELFLQNYKQWAFESILGNVGRWARSSTCDEGGVPCRPYHHDPCRACHHDGKDV